MLKFIQKININRISTELIKKDLNKNIKKVQTKNQLEYPRTFEQKVILLNDPRTIQKLQIIQYGVKYKPSKKYLALILFLTSIFFYINQKQLPVKIVDYYFTISNNSGINYPTGYILAAFLSETPFYFYIPLWIVVNHMTKFISNKWIFALTFTNIIFNGILGQYLVNQRVKQYQVWDQERISYGEGTVYSLISLLWGALGPLGAFTHLKSKIFLKTIPGLGIIRAGIPFGYICLCYLIIEGYLRYKDNKKNTQLISISFINGFIFGLLVRKFSPLK